MDAASAIVLGIRVNGIKCSSKLQQMDTGQPFFNFLDDLLAEQHFSTVLHVMNCRIHFRFDKP